MKKKGIIGLALAAAMVIGSSAMVMAAPNTQSQDSYSFGKSYQLTGGMTETAKSPAETFTFISGDQQDGKANLYGVSGTSYNDTSKVDTPTALGDLPDGKENLIPDKVKYVEIGSVSYLEGDAKNAGNVKPVSVTVPDANEYGSVGYYYYKFTEKPGDTQGVTYSGEANIIRVAVTNDETGLKIGDVRLMNENMIDKKDNVVNSYASGRVKIVKSVTGNMGDKNREFEVTVTFDAAPGKKIKAPVNITTDDTDLENVTILNPEEGGSREMQAKIKVKDETTVEFTNLPEGASYTIKETQADGYEKPQYRLNGTETSEEAAEGISGTVAGGTEEMITIVNRKNSTVDTGVFTSNLPYIIILAGAAAGLALFFAGKKRAMKED